MISLNQLRFFIELSQQHSFSKAAEICCVTQPALSNSISQLEEELDGKLFNRSTRKVQLTALGKHLRPLANEVLTAQKEFIEGAKAFNNPQHQLLRIGLSPLIDMKLLAEILQPFKNQQTNMEIFFKECFMNDLSQRMEDETIDIAIMPKRESHIRFDTFPLYSEPLYFLPCERHGEVNDRQNFPTISFAKIADETIIVTNGCGLRETIHDFFTKDSLSVKEYTGQALSYKVVEDWAELGVGAGILPKSKLSPENKNAKALQLSDGKPALIEYEVSYSRHIERTSHISDFIVYLQNITPEILHGRAV